MIADGVALGWPEVALLSYCIAFVGLAITSAVIALRTPKSAWRAAGYSRTIWIAAVVLLAPVVLPSLLLLTVVRPRLREAHR